MTDAFASSDDQRSAQLSSHTQWATFDGPIPLDRGGTLPGLTVAYETWGTLDADRQNAVCICHALTGDAHCASHGPEDNPGWWEQLVGPGKAIDTDKYFVVCANILGSCYGTTGPASINPETGEPFGPDFPAVTVGDMVDAQARLADHLDIPRWFAVVGGSLGGMQALSWATRYPQRVNASVVICSAAHLSSQALSFDVVGRNAILRDPQFHDGHYYHQQDKPDVGLALARMLGHITYLSPEAMTSKFDKDRLSPRDIATDFEKTFSVGSYLAHQGQKFVDRFDANSYLTLSMAMDLFELGSTEEKLRDTLAASTCRWLVLSASSDWLFPPRQSREIVDALIKARKYVSYCNIQSGGGHDAFLIPGEAESFGAMTKAFIESTTPDAQYLPLTEVRPAHDPAAADTPHVMRRHRVDYDRMLDLIHPGESVLDLGCGRGELLSRIAYEKGSDRLVGLELDEAKIQKTLQGGFDVIQADLNEGLPEFSDKEFDVVLLSLTLQSVINTESIVDEMLRVGKRVVLSFPNFAYHRIRSVIAEQGRSPDTGTGQLPYAWYNTPNRRFLSILDWQEFCTKRGIEIHEAVYLDSENDTEVPQGQDPNFYADLAIFAVQR